MLRNISLAATLFVFWLALSGHYTAFLVGVGAVVTIVTVYLAERMSASDGEGHPIHLLPRAMIYWPWLILEIMKSAWSVTRIIIDPRLPIHPTMTRVRAGETSAVGIATYANSITLTPGTITTDVSGLSLTVHAITADSADDLETGVMDRMVRQFEGSA